jgi:hypothetical protein
MEGGPALVRRAYVHIGLPKTGTTYVQQTLWSSRDALAAAGVLIPGERHQIQRQAIWDLLGRRLRGVGQPEVAGSWAALVETVQTWAGDTVLLSEEFLVHARRSDVRQIVEDFGPAEIHVVVTVRDLGRAIGSMWQQEVAKQLTMPWPEYVAAVRNPSAGKPMAGIAFWLRYDLEKILATWETAVARERIHVLTVPPAGSPVNVLLERFALATGIEYDTLKPADGLVNPAVGVTGTEVLLRLNQKLATLDERQYLHVTRVLRTGLSQAPDVKQPSLPSSERAWVARKAAEVIELLDSGGYDVVGDLTDLLPTSYESAADDGQQVADRQLADAALVALAHLCKHHAHYWSRTRRLAVAGAIDARPRLASARRALSYRVRAAGLRAADRHELLARAAALYFRRISPQGLGDDSTSRSLDVD